VYTRISYSIYFGHLKLISALLLSLSVFFTLSKKVAGSRFFIIC